MISLHFMQPKHWLAFACAVFAANFVSPIAAQAKPPEVIGYSVEGYEMSPQETQQYKYALETMREGIAALDRGNWMFAKRQCGSALETMYNLRMPERGTIAEVYMLGRACVADSQIAVQNYEQGCRTFSRIGYYRSRFPNTNQLCRKMWQSDEQKLETHSAYSRVFARFAGYLIEMNDLSSGPARDAKIAQLAGTCSDLEAFGTSVPPAPGAVAYCRGAAAFARNDYRAGCRYIWSGAGYMATAMSRPMFDEQRAHGQELQAMLENNRAVCADEGYRWPAFDQAWPY